MRFGNLCRTHSIQELKYKYDEEEKRFKKEETLAAGKAQVTPTKTKRSKILEQQIEKEFEYIKSTLKTLEKNAKTLKATVQNFKSTLQTLKATVQYIKSTLEDIKSTLEKWKDYYKKSMAPLL
eukprot:GHVS01094375.1.p2 GENE.GHVS01094375.1~~GHVS01094375.1.p2  ORF type:complete len:123 (-),score=8.77 GHVS01094375.1:141-509(-)